MRIGDPGLSALPKRAPVPVVGEAARREASDRGRLGIVTGGGAWGPMLAEFVAAIGLAGRLAPTGGDIARDFEGTLDLFAQACRDCAAAGARAVTLGGAGLVGLAEGLRDHVPIPTICSVEARKRAIPAALSKPLTPHRRPGATESTGLSPDSARLLDRS